MTLIRQSLIATGVGLTSLSQRLGSSLVIVISMTCMVGVLLSMLSETAGLLRTYETGGDPSRVLVLPADIPSEYGNELTRSDVGTVLSAPGIARGADGHPAGDGEILIWVPPTLGYTIESPELRGIGTAGHALRPQFELLAGRTFVTGRQELIVGVRAQKAFHLNVGDKVILPSGEWPIVGVFSSAGSILDGQLLADAETVMSAGRVAGFGSILVQLESAAAFDSFKHWLTINPALTVTAERQSDYYLRTANRYTAFFTEVAYIVGTIMAIGALFGAVKIMYAVVNSRAREIATLRALGYSPAATGIAVVVETLLLSLTGACCGAGLAWLLFNGKLIVGHSNVFDLDVSGKLFAIGLAWAAAVAILGALPPAIRAGRLSVADALRDA